MNCLEDFSSILEVKSHSLLQKHPCGLGLKLDKWRPSLSHWDPLYWLCGSWADKLARQANSKTKPVPKILNLVPNVHQYQK